MCEGVPVAIYLQGLSLLIGIVAVVIPVAITLVGFYVSRRFSNRIDSRWNPQARKISRCAGRDTFDGLRRQIDAFGLTPILCDFPFSK